MRNFKIEVDSHEGSQGHGVCITFDDGRGVMIYPDAKRMAEDHCMIVNPFTKTEGVATVLVFDDGKTQAWEFNPKV